MTDSSLNALPWRRNIVDMARGLSDWVTHEFGVSSLLGESTMPDNGMANETVLFNVGQDRYVARLSPHEETPYPTFPVFDLGLQRDCMNLVRARTDVPVPEVVRFVEDPKWLGTPFLVMRHIEGEIPRDSPPYVLQGWMTSLSAQELDRLEESTVKVLADIHTVKDRADLEQLSGDWPDAPRLHRQLSCQREYYEWARDGLQVPAIEDALAALEDAVPNNERVVLIWGDSRIGNIIYQDCLPVGVLDWEMATAGPPEVDVAWLIFMHEFMQDMVSGHGLSGMPQLFQKDRVVQLYEGFSGQQLDDLSWYLAFAALRFAIILLRMGLRATAFGMMPPTEDPDSIFLFSPLLRRLISEIRVGHAPDA
jgi:aminoglycoside phosphotransferase (APT) family kinase protein